MKSRGEALRNYVARRFLLMIPTFLGITFVTFLLCQFVPGGPIDQLRLQLAGAGGGGEVAGGGGTRLPQRSRSVALRAARSAIDALNGTSLAGRAD